MAKPWAEVAASPEYQSLPPDQQNMARAQYFDQVVAPHVPADSLQIARSQFDQSTAPPKPESHDLNTGTQAMLDSPLAASDTLDKMVGYDSRPSPSQRFSDQPNNSGLDLTHDIVRRGQILGRGILEGVAGLPLLAASIPAYGMNAYAKLKGYDDVHITPATELFSNGLREMGGDLPGGEQLSNNEQLGKSAVRGITGAMAGPAIGAELAVANNPVTASVGRALADNPIPQLIAGGTSAGSSELARQHGVGPTGQLIAGLVGGVGGGLASSRLNASSLEGALSPGARQNAPLSEIPDLPPGGAVNGTPKLPLGSPTNAAEAATMRQADSQAETIAQQGASKLGLHWDALDDNLKNQMLENARHATILGSDLTPQQIARKAVYEALGITPTKAMVTRNFNDALNEQNLLTEPQGNALRDIYTRNNEAIRSQIQGLTPEGSAPVDLPTFGSQFRAPLAQGERSAVGSQLGIEPSQVPVDRNQIVGSQISSLAPDGVSAVDAPSFGAQFRAPITQGERAAQSNANAAYTAAEDAEGHLPTSIQPVVDYLQENAPLLGSMEKTKPVVAYLKQIGAISDKNMVPLAGAETGSTLPATGDQIAESMMQGTGYKSLPITLKELGGLREVTNRAWKSAVNSGDDSAAAPLNQIRGLLNDAEENAGGELYKAYRLIRTAKGNDWENNPLIDKLISDQKGYRGTNAVEDSQVFNKAVLSSTPEQFNTVWEKLPGSTQDLTRSQVANYLQNKTFPNGFHGEPDLSGAAARLNGALKDVGREKLNTIYGEDQIANINKFLDSAAKKSDWQTVPILRQMTSYKTGYPGTPMIEDSQVFDKAVLGSSPEQFGKVWPRLTPDAQDLTRAQMAKHIEDQTFSNMGRNELGDPIASAAKLNRTLNAIGPEKIETVFGKEVAERMDRLNNAVAEISNPPRGTVPQGSAPKIVYRMNLLMKGLGMVTKIPFASDAVKWAGSGIAKAAEKRANDAALNEATQVIPPLAASAQESSASSLPALAAPAIISPLLHKNN